MKTLRDNPDAGVWVGCLPDGSKAPPNSDKARLDWFGRNPGKLKNLKAGVRLVGVESWQPNVRCAIDVGIALGPITQP